MANVAKPVSKPVNTRFCPYLAMVPSINAKKPPKFKKNNGESCKTDFKVNEHLFLHVSWQQYIQLMKKNSKVLKKNGECCKTGFKSGEHTFLPV